jgi:AraC-like DNA-binding protein
VPLAEILAPVAETIVHTSEAAVHRYLVACRMDEAVFMLESSDEAIAWIATRVGYETTMAFSKVFHQHYGFSAGRYRALKGGSAHDLSKIVR